MTDKIQSSIQEALSTEQLEEFCKKHHIRKLALFGSVLRDDFSDDSDVDVLVEFEEGQTPDFFALYEIEQELSETLGGRAIDLVTQKALNRHLRNQIIDTDHILYEKV